MQRVAVGSLVLVSVLASCGSTTQNASTGASPKASTSPSAAVTAAPTPSPVIVPFPDLPVIVGTSTGDLFFALNNGQPAGPKVHACNGTIRYVVAYGRQAAFLCGGPGMVTALFLWDEATNRATEIAKSESAMIAFDGLGSLAYVTIGKIEPSAPIPMTKLVVRDLRSGATTVLDERYGVAFELRTTGEGIAVWRPRNSLSFVRPDAEAGTWLIRGTTLAKFSQHRLIDGGKGRDVLETEPVGSSGGSCCTSVIWRTTAEERLTPSDVSNENAVALLEDGRVVAWRPDTSPFAGSIVIYNGTKVERTDRGFFSAFGVMRAGEWLVGQELSGAPSLTLRAYRITDGAFASSPGDGISAIALLGPKK